MAEEVEPARVRFGRFEFDRTHQELYANGVRVRLQDQPRQVLAALVERPGELVTREVLRNRLWTSDTFVDFEHSLNTAIKKVRRALGDPAGSPLYVETQAKRGYRFIADVKPVEAAAPQPAIHPFEALAPPAVAPHVTSPRWAVAVAAILLAAGMAGWLLLRAGHGSPSADAPGAAARLAVVPFRVIGAGDQSHLGVGIADAITNRLAGLRQIAPRPTSAVLEYRTAMPEPARVATALGVDYLLVGTIQSGDGRYRVSVQLVERAGRVVWARSYDEANATFFVMQDQIADEIVTALRIKLSPPELERLHLRYTENPQAYDLYLRGRSLLVEYTETKMRQAIDYFEQALAVDANYALARAALATACAWFSVRYAYELDALAWGRRADSEARQALDLDPSLADAHLAIASAAGTLFGGFDWPVVLERSAAALALDRSLDLAHVVRMRAFYHLGRFDDVRREAALARAINPLPNTEAARIEVAANLFSGRFQDAADQATLLLAETDAPAVRHYLGLARYYLGDIPGAREMLASARRAGQPDVRSQASLASIEAAGGLTAEARARADAVAIGPYMDHHVAYSLGAAYAQLGDANRSLHYLRLAVETGFPCPPWFEQDTLLAPVRERVEFAALLTRLQQRRAR
jgi:DNA-binding winged helix-turn-helix (wHTH) protein/TolB-like protein